MNKTILAREYGDDASEVYYIDITYINLPHSVFVSYFVYFSSKCIRPAKIS